MYIVSDGGDFMKSMSEYMKVWKKDRIMLSHFHLWCRKGDICGYFNLLGFSEDDGMGIYGAKASLWTKWLTYKLKIAWWVRNFMIRSCVFDEFIVIHFIVKLKGLISKI